MSSEQRDADAAASVPEGAERQEWREEAACPECGGDVLVLTCHYLVGKYCLSHNGVDCYWCA